MNLFYQMNFLTCVLLQCVQFVEQYEPVVVQLLAEMMDPTFVCTVSMAFSSIQDGLRYSPVRLSVPRMQKLCWNKDEHAECLEQTHSCKALGVMNGQLCDCQPCARKDRGKELPGFSKGHSVS